MTISEIFGISTDYLLKETEKIGETAQEETIQTETLSPKIGFSKQRPHYEYKSQKMIGTLPLVHIHLGTGLCPAKGVIAIGTVAQGWLAIGLASVGGFSIGIFSLGLLSLANIALGLIAFGTLAVGVISIGAFSFGIFSLGAVVFGQFAFGASAHGAQVAIGDVANGKIALGYSQAVGSYTQVSNRRSFDYENACRMIDKYVSPSWLFFKTWAKGMVKWF